MKAFAALIDRLETAGDEETAARVLADWLAQARDPERGAALGLLLGVTPIARVGRSVILALAERLDPALLAIGREVAGELAETIALMWPGPTDAGDDAPRLADVVAALSPQSTDRAALAARLIDLLDLLGPAERVVLLRLATGHIAGMLPARVAQDALARIGGVPLADVEAIWHAVDPPYEPLFAWLEGRGERPSPARFAPFRHLTVVTVREPDEIGDLDPAGIAADAAWDGLRVLAVAHAGMKRLYSRRGVDVAERFPELLALLEDDVVLEGVVLVRDAAGRFSSAALEARLGRRQSTRRGVHRGEGAVLMLHDVLELRGADLRETPLRARRAALEDLAAGLLDDRAALSPLLPVDDWSALAALRSRARGLGAAGVVLKPWDAPYTAGAAWTEVRCEPISFVGVLLYIEWTSAIVATVGVWEGEALVPIAKVVLEDPETASFVARYVGDNAVDRFGPVMQARADVEAGLVLEAAFDAIERAPRRKAGVLLRGARLVALHPEASPREAARLDDLRALLR